MVLHLELVTLHQHGRGHARHHLVLQRADLEHRLAGADDLGEAPLLLLAVGVDDLDGLTHHTIQRMQDGEAGAVGEEVGRWRAGDGEVQRALGTRFDLRHIVQALGPVLGGGGIADGEAVLALPDLQVVDGGRIGAPVLVAHQIGDAAQHLGPAIADVAQRAIVEHGGDRPRREGAALAFGDVGAGQLHCAGKGAFRHGVPQITCSFWGSMMTARVMSMSISVRSPGRDTSWAASSAMMVAPPSGMVA